MKNQVLRTAGYGAVLVACGLCCSGCIQINTTAQLPSFETPFLFPLPPGAPILTNLELPVIELCERVSRDAILDYIRQQPLGNFLVGLFQSFVHIQEVTVPQAVMEVLEPQEGTFDGLTEVTFLLNGQPLLTAQGNAAINGKTITLTADNPTNLTDTIEDCENSGAELTVTVKGQVPPTPPTRWRNIITIHVRARIGLF